MTSETYILLEARFRSLLDRCGALFSPEALADIDHWVRHAELEMAVESFCLSLRAEGVRLSEDQKQTVLELGPELGLDKETVFEDGSWDRTVNYLRQP
jgi:hypothetical protein